MRLANIFPDQYMCYSESHPQPVTIGILTLLFSAKQKAIALFHFLVSIGVATEDGAVDDIPARTWQPAAEDSVCRLLSEPSSLACNGREPSISTCKALSYGQRHTPAAVIWQNDTDWNRLLTTKSSRLFKKTQYFTQSFDLLCYNSDFFPRPTGQDTPVPDNPQYPFGFLWRYCWW